MDLVGHRGLVTFDANRQLHRLLTKNYYAMDDWSQNLLATNKGVKNDNEIPECPETLAS